MKTKIKNALILIFGLLITFPSFTFAQGKFSIEAPKVVEVGEMFNLTYVFNVNEEEITPPELNGHFRPLTNFLTQSTMNINGRVEKRYGYALEALEEGKFTLGPAILKDENGNEYRSNNVTIEVVKNMQKQQQQGYSSRNSRGNNDDEEYMNDLFIRIIPTKTTLYRGDNLNITIKCYVNPRIQINGVRNIKTPSYNGFISKDAGSPREINFERENVNGKIYAVAVLGRYTLYPQQTGAIKIDPYEATWSILKPIQLNMWAMDYDEIEKKIVSPPITINVKDLPAGAPISYTGAVGKFAMSASLSRNKVTANEAISLNVRISGNGNTSLITAPNVNFPHDFDVFDSKKSEKSDNQGGAINFEYPVIPRSAGTFTIEPIKFTYFNPADGKYTTVESEPMTIEVEKDPNAGAQQSSSVIIGNNQRDVKVLGTDIHYVKTEPQAWSAVGSRFLGSKNYYPFYIALIALFAAIWWFLYSKNKNSQNIVLMRNRKAKSIAKKRLKTAEKLMKLNSSAGFYDELMRAVWGYLGDKFSLPVAELSRDNVSELLAQKNVEKEDIDKLIGIVDECEFARYASGASNSQMRTLYDNTIDIISKLEQKTK